MAEERPATRATDDDTRQWTPGDYLAVVYTFGYLAMVGAVIYFPIPSDNSQMLNTLVTIMSTIQIGIGKCYYDRNRADISAQKVAAVELARSSSTMREIASTAAPAQARAVAAARAPAPEAPIAPVPEVGPSAAPGLVVTPAEPNPETGNVPAAEVQGGDKPK